MTGGTSPPSAELVLAADFDTFYRRTYPDLVRTLTFTLGDVELGREAADEAMARCCARWAHLATYRNPGGWAYRVGLNWARSMHRRLARSFPLTRRQVMEPAFEDPEVGRALARLDSDQRAVVVLRVLCDWSVAQTADALGVRPGTVKSRLHRALASLRDDLGDDPLPMTSDRPDAPTERTDR